MGVVADFVSPLRLVACAIVLLVLRAVYNAFAGPLSSLPGPWYTKWTDIHLRVLLLSGKRAKYVHSLHEKYGPVVRIGPNDVDIGDRDAAREIHKAKSGFLKSSFYGSVPRQFQSMFSTRDPSFHTGRRRLLGPCFTENALSNIEPEVLDLVRLAVQRMGEESRTSGSTDVLKWWTMMAMDVIGQVSFGESFDLLQSGTKTQFADDIAMAGSILPLRTAFPTLVWLGPYLPSSWLKNIGLARQRMMAYHQNRVSHYLEHEKDDPEKSSKTIFSSLTKGDSAELSQVGMTMETLSYITAGTDTTAVTLTYLLWVVCQHKQIQETLVRELQELPEEFSYRDVRDLRYLNLVIEETLRLYGAVSGSLPRDVPAEGATLAGRYIPGNTVVSTQAYTIHRDPEVFAEPERFDPTRWENPTKEMQDASQAFGTGPRGCIGIHLARMELRLGAALFFKNNPNAKVSTKNGMSDEDMEQQITFLVLPKGHRCLIEAN